MLLPQFKNLKLVIFDVDGTLYSQSKLRNKMIRALLGYYIVRPWSVKELLIIYHFRKERELKAGFEGDDLYNQQFEWCAAKMKVPVEKVKAVINKWIFEFPNKYLADCMYPDVKDAFETLRGQQILIAIYSDYDAEEKIRHMNLFADLFISSTDSAINAMKPSPKGLNYIIEKFEMPNKAHCIFIGDRIELDGKCAMEAHVPFILAEKELLSRNFYKTLSKKILNVS